MSPIFVYTLVLHVLLGLAGVACSYAHLTHLLARRIEARFLKRVSLSAVIFYCLSWAVGGFYYVAYYGPSVKPVIIGGGYGWAHKVFTEGKEHIFLFLPFLAIVIAVLTYLLADELKRDDELRRALVALAAATVAVGAIVTLSGVAISGGVR